jgi:hypothetical protein
MPDYKLACGARLPGGTHDHNCYYTKDHGGLHACLLRGELGCRGQDQREEDATASVSRGGT